jgi:excisionase family DNA binding protein
MSKQCKISTASPRFAPLDHAATSLGCSIKTVRRYIADGRLTGYRMGPRLLRVDMNEVEALLSPIPTTRAS